SVVTPTVVYIYQHCHVHGIQATVSRLYSLYPKVLCESGLLSSTNMWKVTVACVVVLVGAALATSNLDLWDGAKDGDLPKVQEALDAGANPDWQNEDKWGTTAIIQATK
ncbi:unnamed protein product, partial [Meganyctiphanes norvegica]